MRETAVKRQALTKAPPAQCKSNLFCNFRLPIPACAEKNAAAGHTIGNHTANHIYKELYENEESFFSALYQAEQIIAAQTGIRTSFMRFPGGSHSIHCHSRDIRLDLSLTRLVQEAAPDYFMVAATVHRAAAFQWVQASPAATIKK